MKKFVYNFSIPDTRLDDVVELKKFIMNNLCVDKSLIDAYHLWESISESWSASWLNIDTHPEGETREEFLIFEMNKRGYFIDM